MAKITSNGTEVARFVRVTSEPDGSTTRVQLSLRSNRYVLIKRDGTYRAPALGGGVEERKLPGVWKRFRRLRDDADMTRVLDAMRVKYTGLGFTEENPS